MATSNPSMFASITPLKELQLRMSIAFSIVGKNLARSTYLSCSTAKSNSLNPTSSTFAVTPLPTYPMLVRTLSVKVRAISPIPSTGMVVVFPSTTMLSKNERSILLKSNTMPSPASNAKGVLSSMLSIISIIVERGSSIPKRSLKILSTFARSFMLNCA